MYIVSMAGLCGRHGHFQCDDGYCVSTDLHCDGVAHCFDGTDETNNCSHSGKLNDLYNVKN